MDAHTLRAVLREAGRQAGFGKHSDTLWPVYTRGDTRASSASPPVWATATSASDGHPVIDEVAIHHHPASCNIGASLSGQLSVLR